MKNIHILPTDKPSRLYLSDYGKELNLSGYPLRNYTTGQHIFITSDEEIKSGDWYYLPRTNSFYKCNDDPTELNLERRLGVAKIILTDNKDLIKDGVQAIDDEFLEWFVKNPSCEYVEVEIISLEKRIGSYDGKGSVPIYVNIYAIIIPKEKHLIDMKNHEDSLWEEEPKPFKDMLPLTEVALAEFKKNPVPTKQELEPLEVPMPIYKQETLEEVAEKYANDWEEIHPKLDFEDMTPIAISKIDFIEGAKWQQEQDRWKTVSEEIPPSNIELLVESPDGIVHLSSWRESYNIFSCQAKSESSYNWKWKTI